MPNAPRRAVRKALPAALLILLFAVFAAGCGSSDDSTAGSGGSGSGGEVAVVGYSTPEGVYEEGLEPGFEATPEGADVSFTNSFGASGDQSRAVVAGQPADVVHFSQAGDMERLVEEGGLVAKDWDKPEIRRNRPGLGRRDHDPQGQPRGDQILRRPARQGRRGDHARTRSARASARWNIMAVYGIADPRRANPPTRRSTRSRRCSRRRSSSPAAARDALAAFTQGQGDVLLGYENEAIKAQDEGEDIDYVIPPSTILIETPIAVTKDAPQRRPGLPRLRLVGRGPGNLGRERLPPGQPETGRPETVPDPERPLHDRRVRRVGQSQRRVLRR